MTHKKQGLNFHGELKSEEHAALFVIQRGFLEKAPVTTNIIILFVLWFVSSFKETFRCIYGQKSYTSTDPIKMTLVWQFENVTICNLQMTC